MVILGIAIAWVVLNHLPTQEEAPAVPTVRPTVTFKDAVRTPDPSRSEDSLSPEGMATIEAGGASGEIIPPTRTTWAGGSCTSPA